MQALTPIGNNVLFQFLDETLGAQGAFSERTRSGLIVPTLMKTQKCERWGRVTATGADVTGIAVGDLIMIEPLMWTKHVEFQGEKVWKTNTDKIMMVSNDLAMTVQF